MAREMGSPEAKTDRIVDIVIDELIGRSGFDGWWWEIDEETQTEIKATMANRIIEVI